MYTVALNFREDLDRFRQMVLEEDQLLEQLQQTAGLDAFARLTVELGRQRGCVFTAEQVLAAVQEARRSWLERWL
jgi:hypothetical protein